MARPAIKSRKSAAPADVTAIKTVPRDPTDRIRETQKAQIPVLEREIRESQMRAFLSRRDTI